MSMRFSHISIMGKITVAFAVMFVALVALGLTAVQGMRGIKDSGDTIYDNYLVSIVNLNEVGENMARLVILQKAHIIAPNEVVKAELEQGMTVATGAMNDALGRFALTLDEGEETELYNKFREELGMLLQVNGRIVNSNIENVNKAAGETGTASNQVLNAAQEMSRQAEGLRGEVDRFLAEVRSA